MKLRKLTSLTASLAFVLMVVTSIILYLVPHGRVAYWADWRLWGLNKTQWGDVHINVGLLFLLALCLHIYYNWKPLLTYLKDRSRQVKIFTPAFNLALVVCVVTVAGTLLTVPPFSWVLDLNAALKDQGIRTYGEPPYGHAELSSLNTFARKVNLDAAEALQRLRQAGYQVTDGGQTLQAIATINTTTPKALYEAMKPPAAATTGPARLPDTPPPGTGRLTLEEICTTYGLDIQKLRAALKTKTISAAASESMRDIAMRHGMGPTDLYEIVKQAADTIRKTG
ncbi:DUF4405 domain-containing protein [Desulfosarcina alkanivorans]|nr:DUF4405 domain-containing protein [Desulfosarcina alkanivorans]